MTRVEARVVARRGPVPRPCRRPGLSGGAGVVALADAHRVGPARPRPEDESLRPAAGTGPCKARKAAGVQGAAGPGGPDGSDGALRRGYHRAEAGWRRLSGRHWSLSLVVRQPPVGSYRVFLGLLLQLREEGGAGLGGLVGLSRGSNPPRWGQWALKCLRAPAWRRTGETLTVGMAAAAQRRSCPTRLKRPQWAIPMLSLDYLARDPIQEKNMKFKKHPRIGEGKIQMFQTIHMRQCSVILLCDQQ